MEPNTEKVYPPTSYLVAYEDIEATKEITKSLVGFGISFVASLYTGDGAVQLGSFSSFLLGGPAA